MNPKQRTTGKQATARPSSKTAQAASARKLPLGLILGGVFTVLLIVTVFLTLDSGQSAGADEYGEPVVTGSLPPLADPLADPAIGTAAPEVTGADFEGAPVSITDDGTAKLLLFVAHWCPYCQVEVPWVADWLAENDLPDGVTFTAIATAIDRSQENWPPSAWFEREGLDAPVIVDDRTNSVAAAYGLPAYPYWVFVNPDGTIAARISGGLSPADLERIVASFTAP